jgi:2-amino-4-hydroxy-6-hydroxymethyldihydropteridine diphosphokinase
MAEADTLACVGLGANLGDARGTLGQAAEALGRLPLTTMVALSPTYRSAPVDAAGPDFFNAVALLRTQLPPEELLAQLHGIEQLHGRLRSYRNAPRTLDLDLLLYGDRCIATPQLMVPHPRLHQRAFALRPLADVWPDAVIPGLGPVADWLPKVADQRVEKLQA